MYGLGLSNYPSSHTAKATKQPKLSERISERSQVIEVPKTLRHESVEVAKTVFQERISEWSQSGHRSASNLMPEKCRGSQKYPSGAKSRTDKTSVQDPWLRALETDENEKEGQEGRVGTDDDE